MSLIRIAILTVAVLFVASMCRAEELVEVKDIPADKLAALKAAEARVQLAISAVKAAKDELDLANGQMYSATKSALEKSGQYDADCQFVDQKSAKYRNAKVAGKFILIYEGIFTCGSNLTWVPASQGNITLQGYPAAR